MLTRAGIVTLVASVVVLAAGRAFGLPELFVLGAGGVALLAISVGYVAVRRLQVEVARQLRPPRVHAGQPCRVDLTLRNRSRLRSPVLRLQDDVSGTRGVELMVAPMAHGTGTQAVYRLPTDRRGIVKVGPLRLTVTDPFGLARIVTRGDRDASLVVYPHVDDIAPVRRASDRDIERLTVPQQRIAPLGDEFHALREYQIGDDLRRIHWPSSARHDELMVRQDEVPWYGRLTVLLDTRRPVAGSVDAAAADDRFETMVSAAASIAAASCRRGDHVRVLTTGGVDTGDGTGHQHLERILAALAVVEADDAGATPVIRRLAAAGNSGTLVSLTGGDDELDDAVVRAVAGSYGQRVLVLFRDDGAIPMGSERPLRSATVIAVPSSVAFPAAWQRVFGPATRTRR